MLFDLGMSELLLIGVVALVVIGPKDLPKALRIAGFWVKKARTLSREFQSSVEQMIREAELDEMRQELKKATEIDLDKEFRQTIDPTGSLAESLKPPQLPKFSDADLPAAPAPETGPQPALEAPSTETAEPADAGGPSPDVRADASRLPKDEPLLQEVVVTPAQAGVQGSPQSSAAPGFPLARE
jgi:sec-independent protein translocase protein TatB